MTTPMAAKQPPPPEQPPPTPDFEQSLARLEEIVHLLEDGQLGLSEALVRYEEGVETPPPGL